MKKIMFVAFITFTIIVGCQENQIESEDTSTSSNSETLVFTGEEVDSLISEELGKLGLNYEEKMKFLMDYIASKKLGPKAKKNSLGKTTANTHIVCTSGIYNDASDEWVFNVMKDEIGKAIQASIANNIASPQQTGASASIYSGTADYMDDLIEIKTIFPYTPSGDPIITNCGSQPISSRAFASWTPSGVPMTSANVDCSGPFVTKPYGGSYAEETLTSVTWRSDLIPNATSVKIEVHYQQGTNLYLYKTLTYSTPNDGIYHHDDYNASMAGDGFIYKIKIIPLQGGYAPQFSELFFEVII